MVALNFIVIAMAIPWVKRTSLLAARSLCIFSLMSVMKRTPFERTCFRLAQIELLTMLVARPDILGSNRSVKQVLLELSTIDVA